MPMPLNVELQAYDGPLDLLLDLIEKNKVNIFDIPIAEITDQYLDYVHQLQKEDLSVTSEFMVMAAELISIKCRMLLPREVDEEGEEIDPRAELVQQLLEYKTCKYMSVELKNRMDQTGNVFKPETIPKEVLQYRPKVDPAELVQGLTLKKLHEVFDQVLRRSEERLDPIRSGFGEIKREEVSLPDKLTEVSEYTRTHEHYSFRDLLMAQPSKVQIVVTFLAVLELMKYGVIKAHQEKTDGEIYIERGQEQSEEELKKRWKEDEAIGN